MLEAGAGVLHPFRGVGLQSEKVGWAEACGQQAVESQPSSPDVAPREGGNGLSPSMEQSGLSGGEAKHFVLGQGLYIRAE